MIDVVGAYDSPGLCAHVEIAPCSGPFRPVKKAEHYSKPHVMEKKNSARAASKASR